jgi:formylglycine-generating enzyme
MKNRSLQWLVASAFAPPLLAQTPAPPMQVIGRFEIDRTEVSIGQYQKFADATKTVTAAERAGGGSTYEAGWEQRRGWTWRAPFGKPGAANEPAVHVN